MIHKLQEAKTIQDFNDFVSKLDPDIGKRGGRYFKTDKYSYSMNQIVDQFKKCVKQATIEGKDLDSPTIQQSHVNDDLYHFGQIMQHYLSEMVLRSAGGASIRIA